MAVGTIDLAVEAAIQGSYLGKIYAQLAGFYWTDIGVSLCLLYLSFRFNIYTVSQ